MSKFDNPSYRARYHTSLLGHIAMAKQAMNAISNSPTTTLNQQQKAQDLWIKLTDLYQDISNNRDDI